jgi:hypothetical protein
MMEFNSLFSDVLVEAHQEDLRRSNRPRLSDRETGVIRKAIGTTLIRLGERLGGTPRTPAPPVATSTLATH